MTQHIPYIFFGTDDFSVMVLDELEHAGFLPVRIVTAPDKPRGRGNILTPPAVQVWGGRRHIPVLQPAKLKDPEFLKELSAAGCAVFVVAAYGKIIPPEVLHIPPRGTLNVHPSLLPRYRGPSPVQSQILAGEETVGVSIMLLDEEVDHGPIVDQVTVPVPPPHRYAALLRALAEAGGQLLARIMEPWVRGELAPEEQNHAAATFTKKFATDDGRIDRAGDPLRNFRTFCALSDTPGVYFLHPHGNKTIRVKITDARFEDGQFIIASVVPEGKREMTFEEFKRGYR